MVSVATIQLCHCSRKTAIGDPETNGRGHAPIKLYLQSQMVGRIWSVGCIVRQSLVYTHKMSVHHFICLLHWIKISLEFAFLSFIIISQEEESYQTGWSMPAPRQLPEIIKCLQNRTTLKPAAFKDPCGEREAGLLMTKLHEDELSG